MSNNAKQGEFCWNELMTSDVKKSKDFYSKLFGWKVQDHDMGHMTYTLLKQGDKDVAGMMQIPADFEHQIPPHWMSYIYVENLEDMVSKARSLGAMIKQEPMPVGDFGRLAVLQDPTGAHIALWESTKSA